MQSVESKRYYGAGYEDVQHRRPSIRNAKKYVDWEPHVPVSVSVRKTLDYFLTDHVASMQKAVKQADKRAASSGAR
jgi:UDP-4-amino-4-deoxy-L-arabinose formyltransferase/UDP-glucuronic acid dehydrogenase (UDP-4-keto-hexauronic acid decarboxylating)